MDRASEIVSLLGAMKRRGYSDGNAAQVLASLAHESPRTRGFSDETLIYAHLSLFSSDPEHLAPAIDLAQRACRHDLLDQLLRIAENYREPENEIPIRMTIHVEERFREHCDRHGITILRQLQAHVDGLEASRAVFLALDTDGLVKVFKELREPETSRLGLIDDEHKIYERLGPIHGLPNCYGTTVVDDDLRFLRMSVCHGRMLSELLPLPREEADYVIGRLAGSLASLHSHGVVYNDLRMSNVKVDADHVYLLDVGDAQFLDDDGEVATYVHGPRHVAPEVILRHKAQPASDVFQLGVLYHELLALGRHPFSEDLPPETDRTLSRLRDCLANVMRPTDVTGNSLLARMLAADPVQRPTAAEIAKTLRGEVPHVRAPMVPSETNGTVLFPARIGIPHRGHVDFVARLLELGYDVLIAFGASYVQTPLDPLPKWTVLKMLGRSLELRGFDMKRVRFACTPLFKDDSQIGTHYAFMPGIEKVVAVASGNQEVHSLFKGRWPIIDQAALFAMEGEIYETRSWGGLLREAVNNNDKDSFEALIAPGAEEVLSFDEIRSYFSRPVQAFSWGDDSGRAVVVLRNERDEVVIRQRISTYSTPEDALVKWLGGVFVERFCRHSVVKIGRSTSTLVFEDTTIEGKNLEINYRLEA